MESRVRGETKGGRAKQVKGLITQFAQRQDLNTEVYLLISTMGNLWIEPLRIFALALDVTAQSQLEVTKQATSRIFALALDVTAQSQLEVTKQATSRATEDICSDVSSDSKLPDRIRQTRHWALDSLIDDIQTQFQNRIPQYLETHDSS
ncbi:hypothetical protein J6590_003411 [Homalodisca vitripennis]|nr:hypothetical protein J6590_003411 [Homalodisca vitripennis]